MTNKEAIERLQRCKRNLEFGKGIGAFSEEGADERIEAYDLAIKALDAQPADDKAEWIYCGVWSEGIGMGQVFGDKVKCSNCMTEYRFTHRFCPYCGRRMKNGKL